MARPKGEKPPDPTVGLRVDRDLWLAAKRVCDDLGTSRNAEIVKFLERLVRDHPGPREED